MLWKHKLTNHTQTLQWNTLCAYPCIIQEECTNRSRVWKYWHIWSRYGSRKDPFHFLILRNDFPLESLAPVTADTPLSMDDTMSLHCLLVSSREEKAERVFPVWNMKSLFLWKPVQDGPVASRLSFSQYGYSQFLTVQWTLLLCLCLSLSHSQHR